MRLGGGEAPEVCVHKQVTILAHLEHNPQRVRIL